MMKREIINWKDSNLAMFGSGKFVANWNGRLSLFRAKHRH
jgi:hypothetical protein